MVDLDGIDEDDHGRHDFQVPNNNVELLEKPSIGMNFATLEEVQKYYEDYGRQNGFWIRIRTSAKTQNRNNEVTSALFVCACEGKYQKNNKEVVVDSTTNNIGKVRAKKRNTSTIRCECKALLRVSKGKRSSEWKVTTFNDDHNHSLVSPCKRMKMASNRHLPKAVKDLTEVFHREKLDVCKVTSIFGGENMGFGNRDLYNHLRDVRHRNLDGGDAQWMFDYFKKRNIENPEFKYAIQCDGNGRATNFFWVDARSRVAYQYFGDVVSFDTTYRTNKYDMPFAPFTGVNHHFHSIQFGCALLQDETEVTFLWLFETWLQAMGGRPPTSILTDQDLAMKSAIAKVFPNSRHRFCYWHIKKKFAEKFSHIYYKKSKFKKQVKNCLWYTYRIQDFEERWVKLVKEYGIENDDWIRDMYDIRNMWVPVYNRGTFFAGMNTTGRSEGANSFFNKFVTSTTNLKEFVLSYEIALKKILLRERDEDYESEHRFRVVDDYQFLLKHADEVYTRNVYDKFKNEISESLEYKVEEKKNTEGIQLFVVMSKVHEWQNYTVTLDLQTQEGKCECQTFEFLGILCRHILRIFFKYDIDKIPEHFILPRWRKKANKYRINDPMCLVNDDEKEESEALRLSHMCQESSKLACLASPSYEGYRVYIDAMKELLGKLILINDVVPSPPNNEKDDLHNPESETMKVLLLDPNISRTKGRKKDAKGSERWKSGIEIASDKKRKCKECKSTKHDWRLCPKNPASKNYKATLETEVECLHSDQDETQWGDEA